VIEDGRIVEEGTGQMLIEKNGEYAKLLRTQELAGSMSKD
jgi:ABC-type multidrug transport system fused ATPase/permease subunit